MGERPDTLPWVAASLVVVLAGCSLVIMPMFDAATDAAMDTGSTCDDGVDCTVDGTDGAGGCSHLPTDGLCTAMAGGTCNAATGCAYPACPTGCDDANACTTDTCLSDGSCAHVPTGDGLGCDDGDPCTIGDHCSAGVCTGGGPLPCDDGNPCTTDTCDAAHACLNAPNTDPCSDGNMCTMGDVCAAGACVPGTPRTCGLATQRCCAATGICLFGGC